MIIQCYSFYDVKTKFYLPPMYFHNVPDAMRGVERIKRSQPQHQVSQFPEDYQLMHLGAFDDGSGMLKPEAKPAFICSVEACLNPELKEK